MKEFQDYLDQALSNVVFEDDSQDDSYEYSLEIMLAHQILIARKEIHMSQIELSKKIGIQQASLSKIENGEGNPSLQTLKRIALGLNKKLIISLE